MINLGILGCGYVGTTLIVGLEKLKRGQIDYTGVPLGDSLKYSANDINIKLILDVDKNKIGKRVSEISHLYNLENYGKVKILNGVELKSCENLPIEISSIDQEHDLEKCSEIIGNYIVDNELDVIIILTPTEEIENNLEGKKLLEGKVTASLFYTYCALKAAEKRKKGICVINGIPSEIANSSYFIKLAEKTNSIIIGDDISSGQSRLLSDLMEHLKEINRIPLSIIGANWGGNMDFLRLEDKKRNESKRKTKTGCATDILGYNVPSDIRPTGFLKPLEDKKVVFKHIPYKGFNNIVDELFICGRISDSPAAAGLLIDMIRLGKISLDNNLKGVVPEINHFYCKRFNKQKSKIIAFQELKKWLEDKDALCKKRNI